MMSLPYWANSRLLPERKPSPSPTSRSKEPTPQAMPNMVRKERNLCTQRVLKICAKMSTSIRIGYRYSITSGVLHGYLTGWRDLDLAKRAAGNRRIDGESRENLPQLLTN